MMEFDIIVPIYNAYTRVENCFKSLEKYYENHNVVLINDASTDKNIRSLINKYAVKNNWQFIHHQSNVGFVKSANEGLKLSNRHSILLNSDTVVTKPWLKAFTQLLNSTAKVGTITPWSNNAEICSLPNFLKNNKPPLNPDNFAQELYKNHHPKYPVLPTAVGFCMLITKQAKQKVGYFNEEHFGHGYGEENDYSLRLIQKGLKNVLCDNAYVVHIGNQSFSDLGMQPSEETMKRLLQKHPNYLEEIKKYIKLDPLMNVRKNILSKIEIK